MWIKIARWNAKFDVRKADFLSVYIFFCNCLYVIWFLLQHIWNYSKSKLQIFCINIYINKNWNRLAINLKSTQIIITMSLIILSIVFFYYWVLFLFKIFLDFFLNLLFYLLLLHLFSSSTYLFLRRNGCFNGLYLRYNWFWYSFYFILIQFYFLDIFILSFWVEFFSQLT